MIGLFIMAVSRTFLIKSGFNMSVNPVERIIKIDLDASLFRVKGYRITMIFVSLMVAILMLNRVGLIPYVFTVTRHISNTLVIRLVL
jgi:hypothetical protein